MSFKNILVKSAVGAATILSLTLNANAKVQYTVGIGYGIGLFEFNGDRETSTFTGNTSLTDLNLTSNTITVNSAATGNNNVAMPAGMVLPSLGASAPALRTTYKYVGNMPQRILHLEGGMHKSYDDIRVMDRNGFGAVVLGFGWGKTTGSEGLTNPNGQYSNTGSTALFFSLNGKFGLENPSSKLYGIAGLTFAKTDLPYDILPFGTDTKLGDLNTCVVMQPGSALLASVGNSNLNGASLQDIASAVTSACNQIKIDKATYNSYFINIGAGMEVNITKDMTLFAEYMHLMQLNKNKTQTVDYTVNGVAGQFSGVIRARNSDYIKAGFRYYFQK